MNGRQASILEMGQAAVTLVTLHLEDVEQG